MMKNRNQMTVAIAPAFYRLIGVVGSKLKGCLWKEHQHFVSFSFLSLQQVAQEGLVSKEAVLLLNTSNEPAALTAH